MRGSNKAIALVAGIAACSLAATVLHAPTLILAVFAFALLGSLGFVWIEVILQGRTPALELVAGAVGLVLAAPVLGGIALYEAGIPLSRTVWSCFFVGLTLVGDAVLAVRYRRLRQHDYEDEQRIQRQQQRAVTQLDMRAPLPPLSERTRQPAQRMTASPRHKGKWLPHVPPWQAFACGVAVLIAGSAVWIARAGATSQQYPGFTALEFAPHNHSATVYDLGVSDNDGRPEHYKLVLLTRGRKPITFGFSLINGHTWQKTVQVKPGIQATANLYLLPDLSRPYRMADTES